MAEPREQSAQGPRPLSKLERGATARVESIRVTATGAHGAPDPQSHDDARANDRPEVDLAPLLRAAAEGDPQAWRAIVDLYARRVYALARSRLGSSGGGRGGQPSAHSGGGSGASGSAGSARHGSSISQPGQGGGDDDAEEVTQSVFVTVATKLASGDYAEEGRFEAWLFRIAMNRIRDEARRRKRHARPMDPVVMSGVRAEGATADAGGPFSAAGDRARALHALRAALQELPEADREVVELRHHAGMSFREMADVLNEPLGTLLARHHRALRKLKELLPPGVRAAFNDADSGVREPEQAGEHGANRSGQSMSENHAKTHRDARNVTDGRSAHQPGGIS